MTESQKRKKVFISSTSFDLPEHRRQVIEACQRMNCDPLAMEQMTAANANAIEESLRLVDQAEIYIGIFANRYGFVPPEQNPDEISITEMEYNRAVERKIPRLIFFMHDDHPVKAKDVETGAGAKKLKALKQRIGEARVADFFTSEKDLRSQVVEALTQHRDRSTTTAADFHYVRPIPPLGEPYVAHPYTLLGEARGLVGRQQELNWLTDWVSRPDSPVYDSRLFFLVAIGGMGKSALTWHWFRNIAEQEMPDLAGRMWWSFYESDATFENFVIRALAYTSGQSIDDIRQMKPHDRECGLLHLLDSSPHLIVLDGLERILLAYNRHDAARLADDDLDEQTANRVAAAHGLPESAAQSYTGRHRLRLTTDPRAGQFFRKLTHVRASRILVSTRLYPSDLQRADGFPVGNCCSYFLPGLSDDDAVDLWRRYGAKGSRQELVRLFASFDRHPLLIQTLASVVSRDRRANGDFEAWRDHHPDFNPFELLSAAERKSHILRHALAGIPDREMNLLHTIAAFRMPTTYDTLTELFVESSIALRSERIDRGAIDDNPFPSEPELDAALADLEDRGLLGWDRRANRYDLHPIVRGVVFGSLTDRSRRDIYTTLHAHFEPIETPGWQQVESLDDLTPAIELFNTLIELQRYDDAFTVFHDRLSDATLYRLSASRLRVELAERLFPDGVDQPPRLSQAAEQGHTLNTLAQGYQLSGQPGAAVSVFRRLRELDEQENAEQELSVTLCNLSDAQRLSGDVRGAEASARAALRIGRERSDKHREAVSLYMLGLALAVRTLECGDLSPLSFSADAEARSRSESSQSSASPERIESQSGDKLPQSKESADTALQRSLQLWQQQSNQQGEGQVNAYLAEAALWRGDPESARPLADRAWELASVQRHEADFIVASRLQGTAALRSLVTSEPTALAAGSTEHPEEPAASAVGSLEWAHERLHHALTRARACELVEEELPTLIALAELHWRLASRPDQAQRRSGNRSLEDDEIDAAGTSLRSVRPTESIPPSPQPTTLDQSPEQHLAQARELLDDVWTRAADGPYPLFHADALNLLAAIERAAKTEAGDQAAIEAARRAYELSWLQGPPFAYAYGLAEARRHLQALGVKPPDLPPYDDSKHEPMPTDPDLPVA